MNTTIPRVLVVDGRTAGHASSDTSEPPLAQICRLFGYQVCAYTARDLREFRRTLRFVSAVARLPAFRGEPLLVHVSFSGHQHGMQIGPDRADWEQSVPLLSDLCRGLAAHSAPVTLSVSIRGAPEDVLAGLIPVLADCVRPPEHLLVLLEEDAGPVEATLAWTHFFAAALGLGLGGVAAADPARLCRLRARIHDLGLGTLRYSHLGPA